jgi:hypothetical protein
MADLITQAYLLQALAAGGLTPTAAQLAHLPGAAAAASDLVRRECGGRDFARQTYVEHYDRGSGGEVYLRQMPVNAVLRVAGPTYGAISVGNSDSATNQVASVRFASTGSVGDGTYAATGLTLSRVASGVAYATTILFATCPTLGSLASAIVAVGNGWTSTAAPAYAAWSSADIEGGLSARGVLGQPATLGVYAVELDVTLEPRVGVIRLRANPGDVGSPRWGPDWAGFAGLPTLGSGGLRISYDAGYDVVPPPIQQATAEVAKAILDRLAMDGSLKAEQLGRYRYELVGSDALSAIPLAARAAIASYRISRA